jgi:hypothetical protein
MSICRPSLRLPRAALLAGCVIAFGSLSVRSQSVSIQSLIDEANSRNEKSVVVPPGEYRLDTELRLNALHDFTLHAEGARLIFTHLKRGGVLVTDCENLTLRGFTLDYDPLPFTQAGITAIDLKRRTVSFRVNQGYPSLQAPYIKSGSNHVFVFDRETTEWHRDAPDLFARSVNILNPREGELTLTPSFDQRLQNLKEGDFLVFGARGGRGIRIERTNGITLDGLTIQSAPGIAVTARFMDGRNVFRYTIARGPLPEGANQPRLLSTSADGLNYAYARTGPIIENCDFSHMGDDSVNIHGIAFYVADVDAPNRIIRVLRPYDKESFPSIIHNGDEVLGLDHDTFGVTGRATIESFKRALDQDDRYSGLARQIWPHIRNGAAVYEFQTDQALSVQPGGFVEIPAISGAGYLIKGNQFRHHRGRGLRLMASDGLIEGNVFEDIAQAGITLGPEMVLFREAGWVNHITVRGNTLSDLAYDPKMRERSSFTLGAISTIYRGDAPGLPRPDTRHQNITITDNIIKDVGVAAIHISQTANVQISGNTIERSNLLPSTEAGADYGLSIDGPVTIQHSLNINQE